MRERPEYPVTIQDIQNESFDGFDTLVTLGTLEHLKEPWEFLRGLSPTVKELVASVPCIPTKHFNEWHLHDFTKDGFLSSLRELGWTIEHTAEQDESGLPHPTYLLVYAKR